jgi:hypothetical protein
MFTVITDFQFRVLPEESVDIKLFKKLPVVMEHKDSSS